MVKSKFARGIRRRLKRQEEEAQGGSGIFKGDLKVQRWKPKEGQHMVDIVPYFAGKNDTPEAREEGTYMFSFGVHYKVGVDEKTYICPKTIPGWEDRRCPICEHAARMKQEGEDYDDYKVFFPKKRELYNVVVQDSEKERDKGVQVFEVSYHYMGKLLEPIMKKPIRAGMEDVDPYIDFALETTDGKTIAFSIGSKKTGKDKVFPTYTGHRFVDRDYDLEEYLEDTYILDEILNIPSYDEIYKDFFDSSTPKEESKEESSVSTFKERRKNRNKKKEEIIEEETTEEDITENATEENTVSKTSEDVPDTESMSRKELKIFIKKHNVPLDDELGYDFKKYDDEDLKFFVDEYLDDNR